MELKHSEPVILAPKVSRPTLKTIQHRLANELKVSPQSIGYCVDWLRHRELGPNQGFKVITQGGKSPLLVQVKPGGEEVVPHVYIGSMNYPWYKKTSNRLVHFYLKQP